SGPGPRATQQPNMCKTESGRTRKDDVFNHLATAQQVGATRNAQLRIWNLQLSSATIDEGAKFRGPQACQGLGHTTAEYKQRYRMWGRRQPALQSAKGAFARDYSLAMSPGGVVSRGPAGSAAVF